MMVVHVEMLDSMVDYHREQIIAAMRANESDYAVMLKYRARLGSLLISLGQRLRGDCVRELMVSSPSAGAASSLRMPPHGRCA